MFFEGVVGYMPLGLLCARLVDVIHFANATQFFVVSAYLAL